MTSASPWPYITFLAAGTVCYSTMNSATFESLYSAFSRMHVQRTWDAILNAPLNLDDIVFAETLWAAGKSVFSGIAIILVILALGLSSSALILWIIPLTVLIGLTFGSLGLTRPARRWPAPCAACRARDSSRSPP